jgi:hypothetical protein
MKWHGLSTRPDRAMGFDRSQHLTRRVINTQDIPSVTEYGSHAESLVPPHTRGSVSLSLSSRSLNYIVFYDVARAIQLGPLFGGDR